MKLAVFGATGGIGGQVVKQALAQGHTVTAVVRDPARFTHPSDPGLHVVTAPDLKDGDVSGCDAAVSAIGPRRRSDVTVASGATRGILQALDRAGVGRFIAVSAMPVGPVPQGEGFLGRRVIYPLVSRALAGIYADLAVMEQQIAASGLTWTVVRPPRLNDKPRGDYRIAIGGNVTNGHFASRADIAHAILSFLDDDRVRNQAVGVAR